MDIILEWRGKYILSPAGSVDQPGRILPNQLLPCGVSSGDLAFDVYTAQVRQRERMIGTRISPGER